MGQRKLLIAGLLFVFELTLAGGAAALDLEAVDGDIVKDKVTVTDPVAPPPEAPNPFANLESFSGKITSMSATPVGGYTCENGTIELVFGTGEPVHLAELIPSDRNSDGIKVRRLVEGESPLSRGAPVKATIDGKTFLFFGLDEAKFKATLGILHAARLTNREVAIRAVPVPNCANAYFAAEATLN